MAPSDSDPVIPGAPRHLVYDAETTITDDVVPFKDPETGEVFLVDGMTFEAVAADRRRRLSGAVVADGEQGG